MRIYLYLINKLLNFSIPQEVLGSFSFDENPEEESKLINIEARDGKWYLYSTTDTKVIIDGNQQEAVLLEVDHYYILRRASKDYCIFVANLFDASFNSYLYKQDLNLLIGNDASYSLVFSSPFLGKQAINIYLKDGQLVLKKIDNAIVYINNVLVNNSIQYLNIGSTIHFWGLKILILNGLLLINNPMNSVSLHVENANITPILLKNDEKPKDLEIKDVNLYTKEQYFSKSPRLRRIIETKIIELSPPPKSQGEDEMPLILTIGPMLTMGIVSLVMVINTVSKIQTGVTTIANSWPQLASALAMLISMLFWPIITKMFNKRLKRRKQAKLIEKYTHYLNEKEKDLQQEEKLQREILIENLIPVEDCLPIIKNGKIGFWDKRIEQNDFLEVRIGIGNALLDVEVNYPEEGFSIDEDELRKKADELVQKYKYINNVPLGYSLYKNKITAFIGLKEKCYGLLHNIILQLITFYGYDDIKLVFFTNEQNEDRWDYAKYLNHTFANDKSIRFFSTNIDNAKKICDFLSVELQNRIQLAEGNSRLFKPYYIIITDDYDSIKRHAFTKTMTELDVNLGFSLLIIENLMSKLPSKCNNFINLGERESSVLTNSFENQEQSRFKDEINYSIQMSQFAQKLSNIPIEFQEGSKGLPESITFLEMEKVGKVDQLNILNRWKINDSTTSLKAEVGVDEDGNLMYLDLHEKFHGPHGLIAGMTGSGKSEFIITYILSMAINYSPDDVAFILIDYKGGGLAFAFENKATGVTLPHLAGTITNLDKAEMDRTLVSIDSEIKRRQQIFNKVRDALGESTIDIYKYQKYFKEGRINEPVPHLFIICDEFAELKSQQPEFMDNLISVARIGRSLGVHLILATQKPSGVVNDQIWSNTKFRVCLKVQDESDSKEMLKRPEAASLKQTGRFYLQVGYDEYFALGQSAWCGAKYYPSERIIKQVDKSVNFIDNIGNIIKSIQASNNIKIEAKGEQLSAIINNIIEVSKITNKRTKRLWLNNIDPVILVDQLINKYEVKKQPYMVQAILGEYDAPEKQEQGLLLYSFKKDGNAIIFGNDEAEREGLLVSMIYSICIMYTVEEIEIYAIDYGSEILSMFNEFPQIGGMAHIDDDEKTKNLIKMINDEIKKRKKLLIPYAGSIENYNSKNEKKLPQILVILNNYDAILEVYNNIYDEIIHIARDCENYGINMIMTCNSISTIGRRVGQSFDTRYAFHLTDPTDYYGAFNGKCNIKPREIFGRGLAKNDGIHEFQTASIVEDKHSITDFVMKTALKIKNESTMVAPRIPMLPEMVTLEMVVNEISTLQKVPIGISKNTLKVVKYDFTAYQSTIISANKLEKINIFMDSLLDVFLRIPDVEVYFLDTTGILSSAKDKNGLFYIDNDFNDFVDKVTEFESDKDTESVQCIYIFYGLEKLKQKIDDYSNKLEKLFNLIKQNEKSIMIFSDGTKGLKSIELERWYSQNRSNTDGIWIGNGLNDQQNFRLSKIIKEYNANFTNDYGFMIEESNAQLIKLLNFGNILEQEELENEE